MKYLYKTKQAFLNFFGLRNNYILKRKYYISENIYKKEIYKIFNKLWIFVGLTTELEKNDWVVKKVGQLEIIITKDKKTDEYFALENTCPHKNIRFFSEDKGMGALVCRYHAWSFNKSGTLNKIPFFDKSYNLNQCELKSACMKSFQLEKIGIFLFVKIKKSKYKITDQFQHDVIKSLKLISNYIQPQHEIFKETRSFNWKLNFENLRDSLHPAVLHNKTLAKSMDFTDQYKTHKRLSDHISPIKLDEASSFSVDGYKKQNDKPGHLDEIIKPLFKDGYYNWLLFPNFHMSSPDGGRSFYIEQLNPIGPDKVEVTATTFISRPIDKNDIFADEICLHRIKSSRPVMEEDYGACEDIQKALAYTNYEQNIGAYEHYNFRIGRIYKKLLRQFF